MKQFEPKRSWFLLALPIALFISYAILFARFNGIVGSLEIAVLGAISFPIGLVSILCNDHALLVSNFTIFVSCGYLFYLGLTVWGAFNPSRFLFVTLCILLLANMAGCQLEQTLNTIPFKE